MGFASGVRAGLAISQTWNTSKSSNPFAILPYIAKEPPARPVYIRAKARQKAGGKPREDYATGYHQREAQRLARHLAIRKQEMAERQQDINAETTQKKLDLQSKRFGLEAQRLQYDKALNERKLNLLERERKKKEDYSLAKWGLATNNPEPIINFFREHGQKGVEIENIEFGPDGKDMLVYYKGHKKPEYFPSKEDFFTGLLAFADPEVEKTLQKQLSKLKSKKTGKQKSPLKITLSQALNEYDRRFTDALGRKVPGAPDKDQWAREYVLKMSKTSEESGAREARKQGEKFKDIALKDGRIKRVWPDGTMEIITKDGVVQAVRTPTGYVYPAGTPGFKRYHKTPRYIGGL